MPAPNGCSRHRPARLDVRVEMSASWLRGLAPFDGRAPGPAVAVAERVRELSALDLAGLRLQWRNVFGRMRARDLLSLYCRESWPIVSRRTSMAISIPKSVEPSKAPADRRTVGADKSGALGSARQIKPGSVLVREWGGHLHQVTALE